MVLGGKNLLRRWWPVVLWFSLAVGFAYLPVWFQRKLVFGSHVPLCILAGISLGAGIFERFADQTARKLILAAGLVIGLPVAASTSAYLLVNERAEVANNATGDYYLSDDVMGGLKFLREHSRPDDIVCATLDTSRVIPAISGNTVLWGHWAITRWTMRNGRRGSRGSSAHRLIPMIRAGRANSGTRESNIYLRTAG